MTNLIRSLSAITIALICAAFTLGGGAIWLWTGSNSDWRAHQSAAYVAGLKLFNGIQNATPPPKGITITPLTAPDQTLATAGDYHQITNTPSAARITIVPISADADNPRTGAPFTLVILSPDLVYPIAEIAIKEGQSAAETTASVAQLLASYCSDPVVIGRFWDAPWVRIDGLGIWGCDAAPSDRRLLAVVMAVVGIATLVTIALNLSNEFKSFAYQLRNRRRIGGPEQYNTRGPQELQEIVSAVNAYLETERAQLEGRAAILSGVSHDLGTPATRLRLRTALVEDQGLRSKLEADIDRMTGIIESVLTYTRAEMNIEKARKLSLTALIEATVANYQDMGRSVSFKQAKDIVVKGGSSVFMSVQGLVVMSGEREITLVGRPISLERALSNLIDNALKYGRRATVSLETDADTVTIVIEDEGSDISAADIEHLMAPFKRGDNTATIQGYGLGLTIVATIANLHGGSLSFEDCAKGVAARLTIQRH